MNIMMFKEVSSSLKTIADKIPDFSKNVINDVPKDNSDINQSAFANSLSTRNHRLEGQRHPETDVPFQRKTVEMENGDKVEGVFPVFESRFNAELPEELLDASDNLQFKECNSQLKNWVDGEPDKAKNFFSEDQLSDISNGRIPEGYTWHHSEDKGVLQLVDTEIHADTGHTGGKTIWGGGNDNR